MGIPACFGPGMRLRNLYLVARAVRRIVNWPLYFLDFLGCAGGERLEYVFRDGTRVRVRPGSADRGVMTAVLLSDEYRLEGGPFSGAVVVDIGGHIGCFSLACARAGARVFTYEPVPGNHTLLSENIRANGYADRVKAFPRAVWDKTGNVKIFLSSQSAMHSMFGRGEAVDVPAVRLEDIFTSNNISRCHLLKLDVEGAELEILAAAPKETLAMVDRIVIEFHEDLRPGSGVELEKVLKENGFSVERAGTYLYAERADKGA